MSKITQVRRLINALGNRFTLIQTQDRPHILPSGEWEMLTGRNPKHCVGYLVGINYIGNIATAIELI